MSAERWLSNDGLRSRSSNPASNLPLSHNLPTDVLWEQLEARRPVPLRFALHLSRRPNGSLCPCLEADLPSRSSSVSAHTVTRILDPEHRVPYITLSPILAAAELTILQGLLRFRLTPAAYDVSLAGLEPWDDLWISLPLARSIAADLGLLASLAAILDPAKSLAWSLDEFTEGLSHNWRVPQEVVDAASYSTDTITRPGLSFNTLQMLPSGQQIKTLVSAELRAEIVGRAELRKRQPTFQLHQRFLRWSAQLHSLWTDLTALLSASEEGHSVHSKAEIGELQHEVAPPTSTDVLEWIQLVSSSRVPDQDSSGLANGEESVLTPLSLVELSALRATDPSIGFGTTTDVREPDGAVEVQQLQAALRAKMAMLHRMNLLTLSPFFRAPDLDTARGARDGGATGSPSLEHGPATRASATGVAGEAAQLAAASDVAALGAKVDALAERFDRFIEARTSTKPADSPPPKTTSSIAIGLDQCDLPDHAQVLVPRTPDSIPGRQIAPWLMIGFLYLLTLTTIISSKRG